MSPISPPRHSATPSPAPLDLHGAAWRQWILDNLKAGCDPVDMAAQMAAGGWAEPDADAALSEAASILFPHVFAAAIGLALPLLPAIGRYACEGRNVDVTFALDRPGIALCDGFLSPEECDALIAEARASGLALSTVVDEATGAAVPHPERTSAGASLARAQTPLVAAVEARIAALTDWPVSHAEPLQVLRYEQGQEYKAHFDAFPETEAGAPHLAQGGQRVQTVLIYLAAPDKGGETWFPKLGLRVRPKAGSAVIFRNVEGSGQRAALSLHSGEPVAAGEKIVMTCWQRASAWG